MPVEIRSFLPKRYLTATCAAAWRIVQVVHRRDPPPERSALGAQRSEGGGRNLWTHLGNPGWHSRRGSGLGVFVGDAVEATGIGRQGRRRPMTWQFLFRSVTHTV